MKFFNKLGFTTQEVATGMTMAILVTAIAVVTGNSLILDAEEKAHVFNAQALATAASQIITDTGVIPAKDEVTTFTLADLLSANKFSSVSDPSSDSSADYDSANSVATVESIAADANSDAILRVYVKLVGADEFVYLDEVTDLGVARTEAIALTRDNVSIPARDDSR